MNKIKPDMPLSKLGWDSLTIINLMTYFSDKYNISLNWISLPGYGNPIGGAAVEYNIYRFNIDQFSLDSISISDISPFIIKSKI